MRRGHSFTKEKRVSAFSFNVNDSSKNTDDNDSAKESGYDETEYLDYRDVDGIKMPFQINAPGGAMIIDSIKINEPVDEKMYRL